MSSSSILTYYYLPPAVSSSRMILLYYQRTMKPNKQLLLRLVRRWKTLRSRRRRPRRPDRQRRRLRRPGRAVGPRPAVAAQPRPQRDEGGRGIQGGIRHHRPTRRVQESSPGGRCRGHAQGGAGHDLLGGQLRLAAGAYFRSFVVARAIGDPSSGRCGWHSLPIAVYSFGGVVRPLFSFLAPCDSVGSVVRKKKPSSTTRAPTAPIWP
jgi:hypothetical protein